MLTAEVRLELRTRNNRLWHIVFDQYESVSEFCRTHGLNGSVVGEYLNLCRSPYDRKTGELRQSAKQICDVSGLGPNELFPPDLYAASLSWPKIRSVEIPSSRLLPIGSARRLALPASQHDDIERDELRQTMQSVLSTLTPREQKVLSFRFGIGDNEEHTLQQSADSFRVSRERIRQIEAKAIRKLRHPSRSKQLEPFLDRLDIRWVDDDQEEESVSTDAASVSEPTLSEPAPHQCLFNSHGYISAETIKQGADFAVLCAPKDAISPVLIDIRIPTTPPVSPSPLNDGVYVVITGRAGRSLRGLFY